MREVFVRAEPIEDDDKPSVLQTVVVENDKVSIGQRRDLEEEEAPH